MTYLIGTIDQQVAKNGKPFAKVQATQTDKTQITLYVWDKIEEFITSLQESKIYEITTDGDQNYPKVINFRPVQGNPLDFIEAVYPSDEYASQLLDRLISFITDPFLNALVKKVFTDEVRERFVYFPAARGQHHNYRYGLLQHTFEVMTGVSRISKAELFSKVNEQVALAGALLHDVGKVYEYTFDGFNAIDYTQDLYLSSHLSSGAEMVGLAFAEMSRETSYSQGDKNKVLAVQHIIRAHHLQKEWDAVTPPATIEAYLVFVADYFSAAYNKYSNITFTSPIGQASKYETFIKLDFEEE